MYISVKEAAELSGKSITTIYRLCNKRMNTKYVTKKDNKYLIDKEFLLATYPNDEEIKDEISVDDNILLNSTDNEFVTEKIDEENSVVDSYDSEVNELIEFEITRNPELEKINAYIEDDLSESTDDKVPETKDNVVEENYLSENLVPNTKSGKIEDELTENIENESQTTYLESILSKEAIIGVSVGIVVISGFLYLMYLLSA